MDALIKHLENREELSPREIEVAAALLLDPAVADEKKGRLLLALAKKGETPAEIAGFVTGGECGIVNQDACRSGMAMRSG